MSVIHDGYTYVSRATSEVTETRRSVRVTWSNSEGAKFRAMVRQKPNPVGFRARLPGDAK